MAIKRNMASYDDAIMYVLCEENPEKLYELRAICYKRAKELEKATKRMEQKPDEQS